MSSPAPIERIMKILSEAYPDGLPTDGCWTWPRPPTGGGYGQLSVGGRPYLVHRLIYEAEHGVIPDGYEIDHVCHNGDVSCAGGKTCVHRRCCRPEHLQARPPKENAAAANKPRQRNQFKTHCPKGHPYDDANTMWVTIRRNGKEYTARHCKACNRERVYKAKTGSERPADGMESLSRAGTPTCRRGHAYDEQNTKHDTTTGKRRCRRCERLNGINAKRRKKGLEPLKELPE